MQFCITGIVHDILQVLLLLVSVQRDWSLKCTQSKYTQKFQLEGSVKWVHNSSLKITFYEYNIDLEDF